MVILLNKLLFFDKSKLKQIYFISMETCSLNTIPLESALVSILIIIYSFVTEFIFHNH
jgi:hypothetical protein